MHDGTLTTKRYRRAWWNLGWRWVLWTVTLGLPIVDSLMDLVVWGEHVAEPNWVEAIEIVVWLACLLAASIYVMRFPCPRCGEPFMWPKESLLDPATAGGYCGKCGLPLLSTDGNGGPSADRHH